MHILQIDCDIKMQDCKLIKFESFLVVCHHTVNRKLNAVLLCLCIMNSEIHTLNTCTKRAVKVSPFFKFSKTEMIVIGGFNGTTFLTTVEKYDSDGLIIKTLQSMAIGR